MPVRHQPGQSGLAGSGVADCTFPEGCPAMNDPNFPRPDPFEILKACERAASVAQWAYRFSIMISAGYSGWATKVVADGNDPLAAGILFTVSIVLMPFIVHFKRASDRLEREIKRIEDELL